MEDEARILVVDREPMWRTFAAQVLGANGYIVHTSSDVNVALKEIDRHNFELIIVDALLDELLKILASDYVRRRLLVVTVSPSVPEAILAYRYGALDYVGKAFDESKLLDSVVAALRKQPARQAMLL